MEPRWRAKCRLMHQQNKCGVSCATYQRSSTASQERVSTVRRKEMSSRVVSQSLSVRWKPTSRVLPGLPLVQRADRSCGGRGRDRLSRSSLDGALEFTLQESGPGQLRAATRLHLRSERTAGTIRTPGRGRRNRGPAVARYRRQPGNHGQRRQSRSISAKTTPEQFAYLDRVSRFSQEPVRAQMSVPRTMKSRPSTRFPWLDT